MTFMYPVKNSDSGNSALLFVQLRRGSPDFHGLLFALPHAQFRSTVRRHSQFPGALFFRGFLTFAAAAAATSAAAGALIIFAHVSPFTYFVNLVQIATCPPLATPIAIFLGQEDVGHRFFQVYPGFLYRGHHQFGS